MCAALLAACYFPAKNPSTQTVAIHIHKRKKHDNLKPAFKINV